jgi:ABC-type transporter Mla subunit MlaD
MAENESIGGISIAIVGDYSKLKGDIETAAQIAAQGGEEIAGALSAGAANADKLSGSIADAATGIANFEARIQALVDTGSTLAEALAAVQGGATGVAEGVDAAGGAAAMAAEQMALFDEALMVPYEDAAGQLNLFADALEPIPGAAEQAGQAVEDLGQNAQQAAPEVEQASVSAKTLVEQLVALGVALEFTKGLVSFAHDALEAADAVDDATKAMGMLSGNANEAANTVAALRNVAKDAALEMPQLLTAANRMTAFLGSSKDVPTIMRAVADSAAVMGTTVEGAAGGFERIVASGDLSQRSLMRLGLTMNDVAKQMGITAAEAADAFKALDQSEKITVMVGALDKFNGAAKELADDSLGAMVRLGNQWHETLEAIGKALDPVIKAMADFASSNIMPMIRNLAEAFASLPGPVKEIAIGVGIFAAALVPLAALVGGISLAISGLGAALAPVVTAFASMGGAIAGAGSSYAAMVATGVLATGVWIALAGAILYAANAYWEMKKAEEGAAEAKKTDEDALLKLEVNLRRQGIAIDELQQKYHQGMISQTDYVRGLRDLVLEHQKAHPVLQQHAEALQQSFSTADAARIRMTALGEAVASTRKNLEQVTLKYNEHKASAADVAKAYDAWQAATGALHAAQERLLPVVTNVHKATREFVENFRIYPDTAMVAAAATDALGVKLGAESAALAEAQDYLVRTIARYKEHNATAAEVAKALDTVEAAQQRMNKTMGEMPEGNFTAWAEPLKQAAVEAAKLLPPIEAIPPYIRTAESALRDLGVTAGKAADNTRLLLAAYRDLDHLTHTLDDENAAWSRISGTVEKLAKTDLPAALQLYKQHYDQMVKLGATAGELMSIEAKRLQMQINLASETGASATKQIVALENIRIKQQALYDQTHMVGDLYVHTLDAIMKGYQQVAGAVADAIFEGKNFGDSMMAIGKQVTKMILEELVATGLKALKNAFLGVGSSVKDVTKDIVDMSKAITGATGDIAKSATSGGGRGGGADFDATPIGIVSSIGKLISSIIGNFQMAAMNKSLDVIVQHTLRTFNELANLRQDEWSMADRMYDRLGEIWGDMVAGLSQVARAVIDGFASMPAVQLPAPVPVGGTYSAELGGPSSSVTSSSSTTSSIGSVEFNIYGAVDGRSVARNVADSLKILSPNFAVFSN